MTNQVVAALQYRRMMSLVTIMVFPGLSHGNTIILHSLHNTTFEDTLLAIPSWESMLMGQSTVNIIIFVRQLFVLL